MMEELSGVWEVEEEDLTRREARLLPLDIEVALLSYPPVRDPLLSRLSRMETVGVEEWGKDARGAMVGG